ncbi:MAG: hypothetical protein ACHREM_21090, partial [Polyangiales bacterium]
SAQGDRAVPGPSGVIWRIEKTTGAVTKRVEHVDDARSIASAAGVVGWTGDAGFSVSLTPGASPKVVAPWPLSNPVVVSDGASFYATVDAPELGGPTATVRRYSLGDVSGATAPAGAILEHLAGVAMAWRGTDLLVETILGSSVALEIFLDPIKSDRGRQLTVAGASPQPLGLAADGADVFMLAGHDLAQVSNEDGSATTLFSSTAALTSVAVDATTVFLTESGASARVIGVGRIDGKFTVLAPAEPSPSAVLSDDTAIYWLAAGEVRTALK